MDNKARIFLIRHGKSEWYKGKVFLGENRIVSDKGKKQAAAAAVKLLEYGACVKRIYSSDLLRAMQTAEIIAEKLGADKPKADKLKADKPKADKPKADKHREVPIIPDILFREMAMGGWDEELIEDIKNKFPEEYTKRGDDIRNYMVPGSENFYDLRGRVIRELYRVFKEDFRDAKDVPGDLVIVAHLGVLSALNEELLKTSAEDFYDRHFSTGSVTPYEVPDWMLI
jgi:broad specificity phosphatase PhoE